MLVPADALKLAQPCLRHTNRFIAALKRAGHDDAAVAQELQRPAGVRLLEIRFDGIVPSANTPEPPVELLSHDAETV